MRTEIKKCHKIWECFEPFMRIPDRFAVAVGLIIIEETLSI